MKLQFKKNMPKSMVTKKLTTDITLNIYNFCVSILLCQFEQNIYTKNTKK
jgi:hypothetical protein